MAYGLTPLINGKAYEWADITINILGVPATNATGVNYEEIQQMKNEYAAGNKVAGRVYGQFEPTASVSMLMAGIEAYQAIAPGGKIQNIPEFPITVSYLDASLLPVNHILKGCRFMSNSRKTGRTDGQAIEVEVQLIIADIDWKAL